MKNPKLLILLFSTLFIILTHLVGQCTLPAGLVDLSTVKIESRSNWLGDHGLDMIQLKREDRFFGKYELGMVKSDGMPKTGFGALAEISFVLGSWPVSADTSLQMTFGKVKAIDHQGEEIDLVPRDGEITISPATSISQDFLASFSLYPNPSHGKVLLSFPGSQQAELALFNVLGRRFPIQATNSAEGTLLNLTSYPPGTYLLHVSTAEGSFQKRILLIP